MSYGRARANKRAYSMSPHRAGWWFGHGARMILYVYTIAEIDAKNRAKRIRLGKEEVEEETDIPEEFSDEERGDIDPNDATVFLNITGDRGRSASINLSNLTMPELLTLKAFVDTSFALAAPAVEARDRKATNAAKQGDFNHSRLYRALPEYVIRRRVQLGYGEGIRVGPEDVSEGHFLPEHFPQGDADTSFDLAERDSDHRFSQDNGASIRLDEEVLPVGNQEAGLPPDLPLT